MHDVTFHVRFTFSESNVPPSINAYFENYLCNHAAERCPFADVSDQYKTHNISGNDQFNRPAALASIGPSGQLQYN